MEIEKKIDPYYAFISYNGGDTKYAKRIKNILERFWIPSYVKKDENLKKNLIDSKSLLGKLFLYPIFRDKDNIVGGDHLKEGILSPNLDISNYLVVLCSPNVRKSGWVGPDEVQHFIDTNKSDKIIPFVIDGDGNNLEENSADCIYPEELRKLLSEIKSNDEKNQILYISAADQDVGWVSWIPWFGRQFKFYKASVRVAAKIIGEANFDKLWQRKKRKQRNLFLGILFLGFLSWFLGCSTDMTISLKDDNHHLPALTEAVVVVNDNDEIQYHINKADTVLHIGGLPGSCRIKSIFSSIPVKFVAEKYYKEMEFSANVYSENNIFQLKRDSTFSIYDGYIIDGDRLPVSGVTVEIENKNIQSDSNGYFRIVFPVEEQTENKKIKLSKTGLESIEKEIEPTTNKKDKAPFLMFKQK